MCFSGEEPVTTLLSAAAIPLRGYSRVPADLGEKLSVTIYGTAQHNKAMGTQYIACFTRACTARFFFFFPAVFGRATGRENPRKGPAKAGDSKAWIAAAVPALHEREAYRLPTSSTPRTAMTTRIDTILRRPRIQ